MPAHGIQATKISYRLSWVEGIRGYRQVKLRCEGSLIEGRGYPIEGGIPIVGHRRDVPNVCVHERVGFGEKCTVKKISNRFVFDIAVSKGFGYIYFASVRTRGGVKSPREVCTLKK